MASSFSSKIQTRKTRLSILGRIHYASTFFTLLFCSYNGNGANYEFTAQMNLLLLMTSFSLLKIMDPKTTYFRIIVFCILNKKSNLNCEFLF